MAVAAEVNVELVDGDTLKITPESVAEQQALERFNGRELHVSEPKPFEKNVRALEAKAQSGVKSE